MNWRLILDSEYSGAWNMARDEALLLCAAGDGINGDAIDHVSTPVLRFYDWHPACVSLGRLQKDSSLIIHNSSFDVVRRPTGGRAVLHQHEITYCAVVHQKHLPREAHSVVGAYTWLSEGFVQGLQKLGVHANLAPPRQRGASTRAAANCFQSAAQCDFLINGKKLIGAAQCRKNDVILQHGSLLLDIDEAAWQRAVGGTMQHTVTLRGLGVRKPREEIVAALLEGMKEHWNITFTSTGLNEEERQVAGQLHRHKYSSAPWNETGTEPLPAHVRT